MYTLFDIIKLRIPEEMEIRDEFYKKISALGIDPAINEAEIARGMNATTFLLRNKGIVIKFFGQERESGVPTFPNESRYLLQPFCHNYISGNLLAIFPLLDTTRTNSEHIRQLKENLRSEGYDFWDDKEENVGLAGEKPFLLDLDAILENKAGASKKAQEVIRQNQWSYITPIFPTDRFLSLDLARKFYWEFDPCVEEKIPATQPKPVKGTTLPEASQFMNL